MSSHPPRLAATDFYRPLVHVLGKLTDYNPSTPVLMDDVYQGVLELTGVNPDDYGIQVSSQMPWVRRWVVWAFRNQQAIPSYERKFNRGKPGATVGMGRRKWALTDAGVRLAQEIRSEYEPVVIPEPEPEPVVKTPNVTTVWLAEKLATTNLEARLNAHLSQKLPISLASGRIEEHIQDYLLSVMERDAWRKRIEAGKPPTRRQICEWATKAAYSTCRKDGQDANMRCMYRARTARDREVDINGNPVPRNPSSYTLPVDTQVISLGENEEGRRGAVTGSDAVGSMLDVADPLSLDAEEAIIGTLAMNQSVNRIKSVLRKRKPGADGRYADEILEAYRLGYSTKELAEEQGVSLNRASTLWAEMRRTLRDAIADGDLEDVREMFFEEGV